MSDVLLSVSANPTARRVVKALGLPLPLPAVLRRDRGAVRERALEGRVVRALGFEGSFLLDDARRELAAQGAALSAGDGRLDGALLDATGLRTIAGLAGLYEEGQRVARQLAKGGRVVVLASDASAETDPEACAANAAVEGFVRSLAKELGRSGGAANLVRVERAAADRAPPVLAWLLGGKSAFVTAQPLRVHGLARALAGEPPRTRALAGKTALVTGAARGIGEATVAALAREGARVLCVDRPEELGALQAVAERAGGRAVACDLSDARAAEALREALAGEPLDVLVHNAGITRDKTLARMDRAQWSSVLQVNLAAAHACTEALLPQLRDEGRVLVLSSVAGLAGNVGQTAYAASKAGLLGWARAQASTLAPRAITVNAVAPGFIETKMTAKMPAMIREGARRLSALGQGGLPEDVAEALLFLASPGAQGLSGGVLRVCGGALVGA